MELIQWIKKFRKHFSYITSDLKWKLIVKTPKKIEFLKWHSFGKTLK
jgi:hypothetical protein